MAPPTRLGILVKSKHVDVHFEFSEILSLVYLALLTHDIH